jgi:hypothetical protein
MIDRLQISKAAYFLRVRRKLTANAIEELFRSLRSRASNPSRDIFRHTRTSQSGVIWSGICFFYDRDPSFLDLPAGHSRERICGFLVVAEYRHHVMICKSGLDLPPDLKRRFLRAVPEERIEAAVAKADAVFEQIRLRGMAQSKHALRAKTLEADDLRNVVPPAGTSRFVASVYRLRRGSDHYSATPSTGRITQRSDRLGLTEILDWARIVIDGLNDETASPSSFIRQFARPIDLSSVGATVVPVTVAFDVHVLRQALLDEDAPYRLIRTQQDGTQHHLDAHETEALLNALDRSFTVHKVKAEWRLQDGDNGPCIGKLVLRKTRISLRSLELLDLAEIGIVDAVSSPDVTQNPSDLDRYIDQNGLFVVLFDDLTVVYIEGRLYKDNSIVGGGESFLNYFKAFPGLQHASSEKGNFAPGQIHFDSDSIFGVMASEIAADDEVLVCDDLGDEWADFIGVNAASQPKCISFYHAKHGSTTLGASALHIAVSQAIKNLGRMNLSTASVTEKAAKWESDYRAPHVDTSIPRLCKGDMAALHQKVRDVAHASDTIRRVCIVASSLNRSALVAAFEAIGRGEPPKPHFIQLYWLLTGFFSACLEVNGFPYVFCSP